MPLVVTTGCSVGISEQTSGAGTRRRAGARRPYRVAGRLLTLQSAISDFVNGESEQNVSGIAVT